VSAEQTVQAIIGKVFGKVINITDARIIPLNPPAIQGLGTFGGFSFQLQDRRGVADLPSLLETSGRLIGAANSPGSNLQQVFTTFSASTPQFTVEVNRDTAKALRVPIDDVFNTLQTALGSQYINDFNLGQRSYRVYVQADQQYRATPEDVNNLYVRSELNEMIPLSNLVKLTPKTGAQTINHFNLFRAIEITGSPVEGASSGVAIQAMQRLATQILPPGFGYEWSGTALEELDSGGLAPIIFGLGLVFVFLVLAAQYENFIDPFIILLAVPLAIFGALLAQKLRGFPNDVYCQVGLVMLIGLASKNSILIVEFANQLRAEGLSVTKAAVEAAQARLRPILMTALSTLLGIYPLTVATGAGAGSRQTLGTAVFGGMFIATFLSLFVVPVLYILVINGRQRLLSGGKSKRSEPTSLNPSPDNS
jgi:HAE1 family hydrophobic/amphiphilic exporter-1